MSQLAGVPSKPPRPLLNRGVPKLALAGALVVGATLLAPVGHAQAAEGPAYATYKIEGSILTVDDDGSSKPSVRRDFSTLASLGDGQTRMIKIKSACAGGEVRAELDIFVGYYKTDNRLHVGGTYSGLRMYEGTSCETTDLDATNFVPWYIFDQPNTYLNQVFSTAPSVEGSADRATVNWKVTRLA